MFWEQLAGKQNTFTRTNILFIFPQHEGTLPATDKNRTNLQPLSASKLMKSIFLACISAQQTFVVSKDEELRVWNLECRVLAST